MAVESISVGLETASIVLPPLGEVGYHPPEQDGLSLVIEGHRNVGHFRVGVVSQSEKTEPMDKPFKTDPKVKKAPLDLR